MSKMADKSLFSMVTGMSGSSSPCVDRAMEDRTDSASCDPFNSQPFHPGSSPQSLAVQSSVSDDRQTASSVFDDRSAASSVFEYRQTDFIMSDASPRHGVTMPVRMCSTSPISSSQIKSPTFTSDCAKDDNFLMKLPSESEQKSVKQCSDFQIASSPQKSNQTNLLDHRPLSNPMLSPHAPGDSFGGFGEHSLGLASDVMFCATESNPLSVQDLNTNFTTTTTTCAGSFDSISSPTSQSLFGHSDEFDSSPLYQTVSADSNTEKPSGSPQTLPEPSPPPQKDKESKETAPSDSPGKCSSDIPSTSSGGSSDEGGNKSDSGLGESDSQQSTVNYASLTPWTTKLLTSDQGTPVTTSVCLAMPPGSLDTSSLLQFSTLTKGKAPLKLNTCKKLSSWSCNPENLSEGDKEGGNISPDESKARKNSLKTLPTKEHRFKRTAEALHKSGLWEVAMKTGNLIKRNRELQKEVDKFKGEALTFLKSVIKNPQNRHYIRTILSNALANGSQGGKPTLMSVVVTAASHAAKSAENLTPSPPPVTASEPARTDSKQSCNTHVETNFLGVETRPEPMTMEVDET